MSTALIVVSMLLSAEPVAVDEELLRAVVQRLEVRRQNLPDSGLLPKTGAVPLRQDSFDTRAFSAARWTVKPAAAWQAEADKANENRYVVVIVPGELTGDTAQVSVGVELVQPAKTRGIAMCCCSATDLYRRDGKRWRFEKRLSNICS